MNLIHYVFGNETFKITATSPRANDLNPYDHAFTFVIIFQLYAAICQNESPIRLGLQPGSALINNLKSRVVALASNSGVITSVQQAAQSVLQNGWSLLLPTAQERAKALSSLLPVGGELGVVLENMPTLTQEPNGQRKWKVFCRLFHYY